MNTMPDQPLIAIDVVPVQFSAEGLRIGTAERAFEPYVGRQALPGVLLGSGELLAEAAYRALDQKAGIPGKYVRHLTQIRTFDGPLRDPRSNAISVAHLAVITPGAGGDMNWMPADIRARDLPFDHDDIVDEALATMRARLWNDIKLTRALTRTVFSTAAASRLVVALTGVKPIGANLHRDLTVNKSIERLAVTEPTTRGRPPVVWRWL